MALTHTTTIRNALANLVVDAIDAGTTDATGDIQLSVDAGFTQIASTILFVNPAFGNASGGTATMLSPPREDSNAAGQASPVTLFRPRDRDNTEIFRGTITTPGGGGDMELSSTTINATDAVRINSFTYSASP